MESIFKNPGILEDTYLPRLMPFRENEQKYLAQTIQPLIEARNGKNLIISGAPGIGKTASIRYLFRKLREETDNIETIHINCWKRDTSSKIAIFIAKGLGIVLPERKNLDELLDRIIRKINKPVAIAFDEIDKVKDLDFLYRLAEDMPFKTIFLVCNDPSWTSKIDHRLLSRLSLERMNFKPYNLEETRGILKERIDFAFIPFAWEKEALDLVSKHSFEKQDLRFGLNILKHAGNEADSETLEKIDKELISSVIEKLV